MITLTFQRCQDIAVHLKFFILVFCFIEICLEFRTACQDFQVKKSTVKCLFQEYNRIALWVFKCDHGDYQHGTLTT